MAGELVKREPNVLASAQIMDEARFDNVFRMAKALAASGMFKDVTQAEQAFGRILLGQDLGLTPTQALMGIDVVRGNVQMRGTLLGKFVRQSEAYDYDVPDRGFEEGKEYAVVALYRRGDDGEWPRADEDTEMSHMGGVLLVKKGRRLPEAIEFFSTPMAAKMKLVKADKPDSAWRTLPHVMVVWRALSQVVKFHAPDLLGGIPVYTEADSIESTATEIGDGEGDGSEPGWSGLPIEAVAEIEALLEVADAFGAGMDRAAVQMRLNGRPEAVEGWLQDTKDMLAARSPETSDDAPAEGQEPEGGESA